MSSLFCPVAYLAIMWHGNFGLLNFFWSDRNYSIIQKKQISESRDQDKELRSKTALNLIDDCKL